MRIRPAKRLRGCLRLPGDKSISHRAAIIAALAAGRTRIDNFSTALDCDATLSCLRQLGVNIERDGNRVEIEGVGLDGFRASSEPLDCRNSGSTMRMLAGVLAFQDFTSELTGDTSLLQRPMTRIIEPLKMMGARIESNKGLAPLRITGQLPLKGTKYLMPTASAQVKTCVLLAGLGANGPTEVIEGSDTTRDHTERLLSWFGVQTNRKHVKENDRDLESIIVTRSSGMRARDGVIPGDISSAAFFIAGAALLRSSELKIERVGLNPTRSHFLSFLNGLGVDVQVDSPDAALTDEDFNEPFGNLEIDDARELATPETGRSNILSGKLIPQLIDELPMIAVLGTQLDGGLSIRDASELRLKESDRITAAVENLRAMGADVDEHSDGLTIKTRSRLRGTKINSYGDHRIAMAFSIAALIADGESEIVGAECVDVSFPEFFDMLESVVDR